MKTKDAAIPLALAALFGASFVAGLGNRPGGAAGFSPPAVVESAPVAVGSLHAAAPPEQTTGWDLPNLDHPRVDRWVEFFQTDGRDDFTVFLKRMPKYAPMISEKLAARGMPQDLVYLAMIESGFNPVATSAAKAKGLWQFIEPTAERYGLTVDRKVDERTDPEKSTEAALSYLGDLYDRFGSWYLAAAAYNTGENRVGRIMRSVTGSEKGSEDDYYAIAELLPQETADYVPLMIAAARIAKEPEKYGFDINA
ncbi:MAG TPA: lytic transglycosylase domain-containing protein [Thermoanaerobaculia bacterium]|nr:lytic transglycosylase domain-containing protein [Thermoanaerobaculia bacterium]